MNPNYIIFQMQKKLSLGIVRKISKNHSAKLPNYQNPPKRLLILTKKSNFILLMIVL